MSEYEFIEPSSLRALIAQAQIDGRCGEQLGSLLLRIHDIVVKTTPRFRSEDPDMIEEARSYSMYRWIKNGIRTVDLRKRSPFSYLYSGTYINILHSLLAQKRDRDRRQEYARRLTEQLQQELPSLQAKDLTSLYD